MKFILAFDVYGTLINKSGIRGSLEELIGEKVKIFKPSPIVYGHFNKKTHSTKSDSIFNPWGVEPTTIIREIGELPSLLERAL